MADTVLATMRRGAMPKLPYDAEVEYIGRATGTPSVYIDTGFVWDGGDWVFDADIRPNSSTNENYIVSQYGSGQGVVYAFVYMPNYGVRLAYNSNTAGSQSVSPSFYGAWHHWHCDYSDGNQHLKVDDDIDLSATRAWKNGVTESAMRIVIGGMQTSGGMANDVDFGAIRIEHAGDKVLDLIPVRFTNELGVSEGAMYDRVSGQLFRNAGTGAFVVGPDKQTYTQSLGVLMPQKDAEPTARDYVQDGLIAMWDGIENAGWGTHDANAPVDLVTNTRLKTVGGVLTTDTTFDAPAGAYYYTNVEEFRQALNARDFTFETVVRAEKGSNNGIVSIDSRGLWIYASIDYNVSTVNCMAKSYAQGASPRFRNEGMFSICVVGRQTPSLFLNGIEYQFSYGDLDEAKNNTFFIGGMNGIAVFASALKKFGNVRLYSRALTADEISHNYAVDKARFKLT